MGNLVRAISRDGGVFMVAIDSTNIVSGMERLHKTSATASAALGRVLTAASLMGSMLKNEDDTLTLQFRGNGPIGTVVAVSDYRGNVRGTCDNKLADLPLNPATGKLDVSGLIGREGLMAVVRDLGMKEPYVGQVPIVSGEIAEDITNYYAVSEQIPTATALGVLVNPNLTIKAAGGFILQLLPGASEEEITRLETNIASLPPISTMIENGATPEEMVMQALSGFSPEILDSYDVEYQCKCSNDRMRSVLVSLGRTEIDSLAKSGEEIEIVCSFCNKKYRFDPKEIQALL